MAIADLRKDYTLAGLRRRDLEADPIEQFRKWFDEARGLRTSGKLRMLAIRIFKALFLPDGVESVDVNAMTLATADKDGRPSARIVLLKGLDARGFQFFTNYESRKGRELTENCHAALVIYWPHLERQVCVAGVVQKLPAAESVAYFGSRPRGSQIGAWASHQGEVVADRSVLETKWQEAEARFPGEEVPMPPYWGGYVLAPSRIEFWQGRPNRLHDRFRYSRKGEAWAIERLAP
jgi:pyridoxamine 5'-phosphate oxidase